MFSFWMLQANLFFLDNNKEVNIIPFVDFLASALRWMRLRGWLRQEYCAEWLTENLEHENDLRQFEFELVFMRLIVY